MYKYTYVNAIVQNLKHLWQLNLKLREIFFEDLCIFWTFYFFLTSRVKLSTNIQDKNKLKVSRNHQSTRR